jgi:phage terminase Nu1 subunit (DNA packaging protein)
MGPSYAQSRAIREAYQAKLAKLEYEERIGKLIDADQLRIEAFKIHRRVRDAILNIPDRCSPQLASMSDQAEVHAYLNQEITAALRQLSADIYSPQGQ